MSSSFAALPELRLRQSRLCTSVQSRAPPRAGPWTDVRRAEASTGGRRRSTLKWFRAGKVRGSLTGFVVTWDVDSRDASLCARLQRFVYGYTTGWHGRTYRYPGFVERDGVRYLGQSVLVVRKDLLSALVEGLNRIGVEFEIDEASIG